MRTRELTRTSHVVEYEPPISGGRLNIRQLQLGRTRLRQIALALVVVVPISNLGWAFSEHIWANPVMTRELLGLLLAEFCLDLAVYMMAREDSGLDDAQVLRWALIHHVVRTFLMALWPVRLEGMLGWAPATMTFVAPMVVAFRTLIPQPRSTLWASFLAAASQPLAIALFPISTVPSGVLAASIATAAVALAIATLCGEITFGLTARAAQGDRLGAYRLVERIGQGSTGEVWKARHRFLARPAAIKTIGPSFLRRVSRRRAIHHFELEAQVTAALTSPHTVTLYDYGTTDEGTLYYAMELLDGASYQAHVDDSGPLAPRDAIRVALEICDSLSEAHQRGLVHGDLRPENVFRAAIGQRNDFTKVLDFGFAGLMPRDRHRKSSWAVWEANDSTGSGVRSTYQAPEVVDGRASDARSDIFQLGAVLRFLVLGEGPRPEGSSDTPTLAFSGADGGKIPQFLRDVVDRCCATDPSQRFASVEAVERRLIEIGAHLGLEPAVDFAMTLPDSNRAVGETSSPSPRNHPADSSRTSPHLHHRREGTRRKFWNVDALLSQLRGDHVSAELLATARTRLGQLALLSATLTVLLTPLWFVGQSEGAQARMVEHVILQALTALSLHLAMLKMSRFSEVPATAVVHAGLLYFLLLTAVYTISPVVLADLSGFDLERMTFAILLVVVCPVFVPLGPRKMVPALLAMGAAQPVALVALAPPEAYAVILGDSISDSALATAVALALVFISKDLRQHDPTVAVGPYDLVRKIAEGGMGEIWEARHELLVRPAAVKLVRRTGDRKSQALCRRRLEREAQLTAELTSPHTVTLYDYGVAPDGQLYFVMQLLCGRSLGDHVRIHGPLTEVEVTRIALAVCDSLGEAHTKGLVHRDLKPDNLFIGSMGRRDDFVSVLDFGVASIESPRDSTTGGIVGTPAFMAPEQFSGHTEGQCTDLYSLGCVMFFLSTGRPPYDERSLYAMAFAHMNESPPRVSQFSPTAVSPGFESVITRCMAKRPGDRFPSAQALSEALRAVARRHPVERPSHATGAPRPPALPSARSAPRSCADHRLR